VIQFALGRPPAAGADQTLFRSDGADLAAAAATLPAGFQDTLLTNVLQADAIAFTPDGRMLIGAKYGRIHVYKNGALLATPALDIRSRTCTEQERGLEGMAVDPDFEINHHIFVYYTFKKYGTCARDAPPNGPVNRLSRFTLGDDDRIDPASEVVLLDEISNAGGYHAGGGVYIGKDNFLYVTVGDGGCDWARDRGCGGSNDAARDRNTLLGKVLRLTTAGGIPADNPFRGAGTARCNLTGRSAAGTICQETYAWGLRNPFRLGFDSNAPGTRFFIGDVGQESWEEIDEGRAGADYGWNVREGPCAVNSTTNCGPPPAGMTNPIFHYPHSSGCSAVTGAAFVPNGLWPAAYDGKYLFADYVCAKIMMLTSTASGYTAEDFATDVGDITDMAFGPAGSGRALYYVVWDSDNPAGNRIHRIQYTGNRTPTAVASADKQWGPSPLTVSFDASGSADPDGDPISYDWNFGDGSAHATTAKPSHVYTTPGTYLVVLKVTDSRGVSDTKGLRIDAGNHAPLPSIESPASSLRFRVGQTITLHGRAGDVEDGAMPASALSWTVLLHHNTHTHPFLGPRTGNDITFVAPPPEDLRAAATSYLEVRLTATDSKGLPTTATRDLRPKAVPLTFDSNPGGLKLVIDGATVTAPHTSTSWEGYRFTVDAQPQVSGGKFWVGSSWSDGGATKHTITTAATPTAYTANFADAKCGGGVGVGALLVILLGAAGRHRARRSYR
jgi:glucose/arabinose dehydrogenase